MTNETELLATLGPPRMALLGPLRMAGFVVHPQLAARSDTITPEVSRTVSCSSRRLLLQVGKKIIAVQVLVECVMNPSVATAMP